MEGFYLWSTTLISVLAVSLISLIGIILLFKNEQIFSLIKNILIALAVGALLGDSFFHLIPESSEYLTPVLAATSFLAGLFLFLTLERYFHWQHHHLPDEKQGVIPVGKLNLISDGFHNFIDGVIIGVSYLVSLPVGVATTLAVILHEVPQELGDYAVLVKSGYSRKKALLFNLLSGLLAVIGAVVALVTLGRFAEVVPWLLGFAAGGFVFMALLLSRSLLSGVKSKGYLLISAAVGFGLMYALTFLEK